MKKSGLKENPRKNLEILVVDSDPVTRLLHNNRLKNNFSFPIFNCSDGREALDRIAENASHDYFVLLAIDMNGMNGWDFLETLRSMPLHMQVHVIIVTCSVSICDKRKAMKFPHVLDYFEKPLSNLQLARVPQLPRLIPYFVSAN